MTVLAFFPLPMSIPTIEEGNRSPGSSMLSTTNDCSRIKMGTHSNPTDEISVVTKL